jgi:hypothetical protein
MRIAGRELAEAYVLFVHYVELLYKGIRGSSGHHREEKFNNAFAIKEYCETRKNNH